MFANLLIAQILKSHSTPGTCPHGAGKLAGIGGELRQVAQPEDNGNGEKGPSSLGGSAKPTRSFARQDTKTQFVLPSRLEDAPSTVGELEMGLCALWDFTTSLS